MFKNLRILTRHSYLLERRSTSKAFLSNSVFKCQTKAAIGRFPLYLRPFLARGYQSAGSQDSVSASYKNGFVILSIPLPSRKELCEFTLRPVSQTVGDLLRFVQDEDGGVDRINVYSMEDVKISKSTPIEILMRQDFKVSVNDITYNVVPPIDIHEQLKTDDQISDLKNLIGQLYTDLNLPEYKEIKEKQIKEQLESLKVELEPFEDAHTQIEEKADRRTNLFVWGGLGFISIQFGFLARLTWWEYSWDIMEPVTYFVTLGTSMACYAYFVLTRQDYSYPDARNRQFHLLFRKEGNKLKFDWKKYTMLKSKVSLLEDELNSLQSSQITTMLSQKQMND